MVSSSSSSKAARRDDRGLKSATDRKDWIAVTLWDVLMFQKST